MFTMYCFFDDIFTVLVIIQCVVNIGLLTEICIPNYQSLLF